MTKDERIAAIEAKKADLIAQYDAKVQSVRDEPEAPAPSDAPPQEAVAVDAAAANGEGGAN